MARKHDLNLDCPSKVLTFRPRQKRLLLQLGSFASKLVCNRVQLALLSGEGSSIVAMFD